MASSTNIPKSHAQPLAVDFIDSRLPEYHPAFKNSQSHFDRALGKYVSSISETSMASDSLQPISNEIRHSRLPPPVEAMKFWNHIFKPSMDIFKDEKQYPKPKLKPEYNIRDKDSWCDVHETLQKARENYDVSKKGYLGHLKSGVRKLADNLGPVEQIATAVPNLDYVSPVLAAVEVILEGARIAAKVRDKVTANFRDQKLEKIFNNIEMFFVIFPRDENIYKASVTLVVSTLKAIEDAIGFFSSNQAMRGFKAIMQGGDYQKALLASINHVQANSDELIHQASISHMYGTREENAAIGRNELEIKRKMDISLQNDDDIKNCVLLLLVDGEERRKSDQERRKLDLERRQLDLENREIILEQRREIQELKHHVERLSRSTTPTPQQNTGFPLLTQQANAWNTTNQVWPPSSLFLQPPMQQPQQQWYGPISTQPQLEWPSPSPSQHQPELSMNSEVLRMILNIPDMDKSDLQYIMEKRERIAMEYPGQAEEVAKSKQFKAWAVSPSSEELLIYGNSQYSGRNHISGLSLLCATVIQGLGSRDRQIALGFFCGRHVETESERTGGKAMISSLIAQLLRQHTFDLSILHQDIDLDGLKNANMDHLCSLFSWLIHRVPEDMILICLIDGVVYYENEDFEEELLYVLKFILELTRDGSIPPALKVLVTSPSPAHEVKALFKDDDSSFLWIRGSLPSTNQRFGKARLAHHLARGHSDSDEEMSDANLGENDSIDSNSDGEDEISDADGENE